MTPLLGLHHVTAFAKDPRANVDFYTRVLGLRLVKRTVNFDDPGTWHLYYGDAVGSPGTLLTHFPNPMNAPGRAGAPEIATSVLAVPRGTLDAWRARLTGLGVVVRDEIGRETGEPRLDFADHDGMRFALVERGAVGDEGVAAREAVTDSAVPAAEAIAGVDRVEIEVHALDEAGEFLESVLGFAAGERRGDRRRYTLPGPGGIELVERPDAPRNVMGAGTVHHVAWRVADGEAQAAMAQRIEAAGGHVTQVMDRQYFHSIYFRIPAGVIFEIATDGPGFLIDEPRESLGSELRLPGFLARQRDRIQEHLVPLEES